MSKEKLNLSEINKWDLQQLSFDSSVYDDNNEILFEPIDSNWINFDEDHGGCGTQEVIFKRVSDNKYFRMVTLHGYDYFEIDGDAIEVTPILRTITAYE